MGLSEAMLGSSGRMKKFDTLSSKQKSALNKILGKVDYSSFNLEKNKLYNQGQDFLRGLMKPGALDTLYSQMEAPMMRQFQEEIVPGIAERFSGMGAQSSSAFSQSMGQAGAGLQERLAALKGQMIQQGTQQQLQAAQMGLGYASLPAQTSVNLAQLGLGTPAFGYQNIAAQPGMAQGLFGGIADAAGTGIGAAFGGGIGSLISKLF